METITKVEKITDADWVGYKVITTQQEIALQIESETLCFEEWGIYLVLNDLRIGHFKDTTIPPLITEEIFSQALIGRQVRKVKWLQQPTDKYTLQRREDTEWGDAIIGIYTDRGILQLVAFCQHNGFYNHKVRASWKGYQDTQEL